ncbi:MAG: hypothetical protein D6770_06585 [Anaerolineae bacterium]|nr:MAG: hypothetical protein D6770_06585 [Anaerolineae bacterium]
MQIRCMYCHTMFTLTREEMLVALHTLREENLQHYDAPCPRCRRATPVARKRLEWANPNWEQAYEEMLKEAEKAEQEQAALAAEATKTPPKEEKKTSSRKRHGSKKSTAQPAKTPSKKKPSAAKGKGASKAKKSAGRSTAKKAKK